MPADWKDSAKGTEIRKVLKTDWLFDRKYVTVGSGEQRSCRSVLLLFLCRNIQNFLEKTKMILCYNG